MVISKESIKIKREKLDKKICQLKTNKTFDVSFISKNSYLVRPNLDFTNFPISNSKVSLNYNYIVTLNENLVTIKYKVSNQIFFSIVLSFVFTIMFFLIVLFFDKTKIGYFIISILALASILIISIISFFKAKRFIQSVFTD